MYETYLTFLHAIIQLFLDTSGNGYITLMSFDEIFFFLFLKLVTTMSLTLKEAFEILSQKKACSSLNILKNVVDDCLNEIEKSAHNKRYGFLIYRYYNHTYK